MISAVLVLMGVLVHMCEGTYVLEGSDAELCQQNKWTCNAVGKVIEIYENTVGLDVTDLIAVLPRFPFLKILDLENTSINGPFPETVCGLPNLQYLNLRNTNLIGDFPQCFCAFEHLLYADLDNNNLEGTLPTCLSEKKFLKGLNLPCNKVTGDIPELPGPSGVLQQIDVRCNTGINCNVSDLGDVNLLCGDYYCGSCYAKELCPEVMTVAGKGIYIPIKS